METLFPAAIFVVGILVMFRGITVRKSGKYLIWIALIFVFGPVLYGIIRIKSLNFLSGNMLCSMLFAKLLTRYLLPVQKNTQTKHDF